MEHIDTIAIDGPAGSGKSTLGKYLADQLGYLFFDTGVMYRAVTWEAAARGVDLTDEIAVTRLAEQIRIDVRSPSRQDGRTSDVLVDGKDITWEIRQPEVDANVSLVSTYSGVRKAMADEQRRIGLSGKVVMVGRDIGTVILPEADVKIYLEASDEERARRRYTELQRRGEEADYDEILAALRIRDQIDSTRSISPLYPADDAVILDSDRLTIEQVIQRALEIVMNKQQRQG